VAQFPQFVVHHGYADLMASIEAASSRLSSAA
jgi:hypothetical protein